MPWDFLCETNKHAGGSNEFGSLVGEGAAYAMGEQRMAEFTVLPASLLWQAGGYADPAHVGVEAAEEIGLPHECSGVAGIEQQQRMPGSD